MHPADGVILAVIALSLLFGLYRGFVREAFSLAAWIAAYVVARIFHPGLELLLVDVIATPSLRLATAWLLLFVGTLLVVTLLGYLLRSLVEAAGVSAADRVLGAGFGLLRGVILVLAALVLMGPFVQRDAWWTNATLPAAFMRYEPVGQELKRKVVAAARSAVDEAPAAPDRGAEAGAQR